MNRRRGFTLLEILIVVVVIGMLAAYVGPRYFGQLGKSEVGAAKAQLKALETALDQYRLDVGHYPTSEQGLDALMQPPAGSTGWRGPYMKKNIPADPWGNPYQYRFPGNLGEFDVYSLGKDGKLGGTDDNADLAN